jgi:hypothetical protein
LWKEKKMEAEVKRTETRTNLKITEVKEMLDEEAVVQVFLHGARRTRVHFFHEKENMLENLLSRHDRPENEYRVLLPEALKALGRNPQVRAKWSQKAGCSCGCSPGFVLETRDNMNIFVTVKTEGTIEKA